MKQILLTWVATLTMGLTLTVNAQVAPSELSKDNALVAKEQSITVRANYPNPFSEQTTIHFSLTKPQTVKVTLYNVLGGRINQLLNESLEAGDHEFIFKRPVDLPDGIYIYTVESGSSSRSMRMIIRK